MTSWQHRCYMAEYVLPPTRDPKPADIGNLIFGPEEERPKSEKQKLGEHEAVYHVCHHHQTDKITQSPTQRDQIQKQKNRHQNMTSTKHTYARLHTQSLAETTLPGQKPTDNSASDSPQPAALGAHTATGKLYVEGVASHRQ